MPKKFKVKKKSEPSQKTPKGLEIPIPTREEVEDALEKIVQPVTKGSGSTSHPKDKR